MNRCAIGKDSYSIREEPRNSKADNCRKMEDSNEKGKESGEREANEKKVHAVGPKLKFCS